MMVALLARLDPIRANRPMWPHTGRCGALTGPRGPPYRSVWPPLGPAGPQTHLRLEGIDDELQLVGVDALDALLHDVVPVLVLDALQHVSVELRHDLHLRRRPTGGALSGRHHTVAALATETTPPLHRNSTRVLTWVYSFKYNPPLPNWFIVTTKRKINES